MKEIEPGDPRISVADPGFPHGGRQPLNLGQKRSIWQNFGRKPHERNVTRGSLP